MVLSEPIGCQLLLVVDIFEGSMLLIIFAGVRYCCSVDCGYTDVILSVAGHYRLILLAGCWLLLLLTYVIEGCSALLLVRRSPLPKVGAACHIFSRFDHHVIAMPDIISLRHCREEYIHLRRRHRRYAHSVF